MRFSVFIFFAVLLLTGCRNVDYVGQKFDPTPMSEDVLYFEKRSEVPPDKYTIIGRFTIHAPLDFSEFETAELLLKRGREYGGGAVCLIDTKQIKLGAYKTNEMEFGAPVSGPVSDIKTDRIATGRDLFGKQTKPLQGEIRRRAELQVRALLLKDSKTTRKLLEER